MWVEIVVKIAKENGVPISLPLEALVQLVLKKAPNTVALEKAKKLLLKDTTQIKEQIASIQNGKFEGMVAAYEDENYEQVSNMSYELLYDSRNLDENARLQVWEIHLNSQSMCAIQGPQSWLESWNIKLEKLSKRQSHDLFAQYLFGKASSSPFAKHSAVEACQSFLQSIGYTVMGHLMEIPLHPEKFPFLLSIISEEVLGSLKENLGASRFFANFGYLYLPSSELLKYHSVDAIDHRIPTESQNFHVLVDFAALSQEPSAVDSKELATSKIVLFKDSNAFVCKLGFTAKSLAFDPKNRRLIVTAAEKNDQTTLYRLKFEQTSNVGVTTELVDKKLINMPGATVFCTNTGKFVLVSLTTFPLVARYNSFEQILEKVPKNRELMGYKGQKTGCLGVVEWNGEILAAVVPNRGGHLHLVGKTKTIQVEGDCEVQSVHQLGTEKLVVIIWVDGNGHKYFGVYDMEEKRMIMKVIIL